MNDLDMVRHHPHRGMNDSCTVRRHIEDSCTAHRHHDIDDLGTIRHYMND
ncbi:hypothetical protein [Desulfobacter sp.]|nr:hypothetical protein [Desulfobacter sp.]